MGEKLKLMSQSSRTDLQGHKVEKGKGEGTLGSSKIVGEPAVRFLPEL